MSRTERDVRNSEVASLWNSAPYPTLEEIGERYGVTRQCVQQWLKQAERDGWFVLSREERSILRKQEHREAELATKKRCKTCGKVINRNAIYGYCVAHRWNSPEWKKKRIEACLRRRRERWAIEPEYRERIRLRHRNHYRRKKARENA